MTQKTEHPIAEIHFYKQHITAKIKKIRLSYRAVIIVIILVIFLLSTQLINYTPDQLIPFFVALTNIFQN